MEIQGYISERFLQWFTSPLVFFFEYPTLGGAQPL